MMAEGPCLSTAGWIGVLHVGLWLLYIERPYCYDDAVHNQRTSSLLSSIILTERNICDERAVADSRLHFRSAHRLLAMADKDAKIYFVTMPYQYYQKAVSELYLVSD